MKQTSPKKKAFKEKIAIFYDSIFHGDDLVRDYPNIWAEFFLLKVNVSYLEEVIGQLEPDELVKLKDNINELCKRLVCSCSRSCSSSKTSNKPLNNANQFAFK